MEFVSFDVKCCIKNETDKDPSGPPPRWQVGSNTWVQAQ